MLSPEDSAQASAMMCTGWWHGRPLVLGGVVVEYEKGLEGHSDADVLLHALIDALLGAAGLGDIGTYFPSSDASLEGISSLDMLAPRYWG